MISPDIDSENDCLDNDDVFLDGNFDVDYFPPLTALDGYDSID